MESSSAELDLLLRCARPGRSEENDAAIRRILNNGIDWPLLARKLKDHGLTALVGNMLSDVASDLVPGDILDAFRINLAEARRNGTASLEEVVRIVAALDAQGIAAVPLKGPVLALRAYGDLGLRTYGALELLIRDSDIAATLQVLGDLNYERNNRLTESQDRAIHRLQGGQVVFRLADGSAVRLCTRLAPATFAFRIDYAGMWRRAQRQNVGGRTFLMLAPEDQILALMIGGCQTMWRSVRSVCDIAAFIETSRGLDWSAIIEHARAARLLRMVLLATSLAARHFKVNVPDLIATAAQSDRSIEPLIERVITQWEHDAPLEPPSKTALWKQRAHLHDGPLPRISSVMRTLLLPEPQHIALVALPRRWSFAYVGVKGVHDLIAVPASSLYRRTLAQALRWQGALLNSEVAVALGRTYPAKNDVLQLRRRERAEARRALAENENNAGAWAELGDASFALKRYDEAISCYDKALAIAPDNPVHWKKRGAAMRAIGEKPGLPEYTVHAQDANACTIRAGRLLQAKRFAEAAAESDRALALDPTNPAATRIGVQSRLFACDWLRREEDSRRISALLSAGMAGVAPIFHRALSNSEQEHRSLAEIWARSFQKGAQSAWRPQSYRHQKIRIAYISTDLRDHVVSDALVGVFEGHDRARFEVVAISLHPGDESAMRKRVESAFDHFVHAQELSDTEVAMKIRDLEIDIAIDLNGNSGSKRTGILALRPAPVQVNYLGYPGTMGAPFIDYVIADPTVIPRENQIHYAEKVAYLPDTYMPNDDKRPIAAKQPTRSESGLPESGFIFACHNGPHKIGPEMFGLWMRLLQNVDGAVLWLRSIGPTAMANLRREANARGVSPERLVFAPRMVETEDHLARLALADLALDTLPYNAHATACDALWAGLPFITCLGATFPGRVAAGILRAIGLPELVASSLGEYEDLALKLALNPELLAGVRAKLLRNRGHEPLFDTKRFTANLEAAYQAMWERQQAGFPPETFSV